MSFKLELSKAHISSAFIPMDVKLFEWRYADFRLAFLFSAWEMSIISSSFNRLWSRSMWRMGGSLSRYSAIVTAKKWVNIVVFKIDDLNVRLQYNQEYFWSTPKITVCQLKITDASVWLYWHRKATGWIHVINPILVKAECLQLGTYVHQLWQPDNPLLNKVGVIK